ncbi:MAG: magnesium transporter [Firmicutes bacterium]|nr:magnesium transporter [Bacillota bacterium]
MDNARNKLVELNKIEEKLKSLVEEKRYKEAMTLISVLNEVDIAELIDELDHKTGAIIYRMLPKDIQAEVFSYLGSDQQEEIIRSSTDVELVQILDEMYMDDMVDMIGEVEPDLVDRILKSSTAEDRKLINQFLKYPEDSAGALMTVEYVSLRRSMTVREAIDYIKAEGIDKKTIYILYVTDSSRHLEGIVSLRELLVSDYDKKIEELMHSDVIYLNTLDEAEEVTATFKKYGFEAVPVVDREGIIVGIITIDDILNLMEEMVSADFQKMSAITPSEKPYLETSVFELAKNRIVWLLVLMVSATVTQKIINGYEDLIGSVAFLSGFIPMLMGAGGNSGSQSSILVIRGLATGDIITRDWLKVIWKEMKVSIICGIILAIVNYFKIIYLDKAPSTVALTVSLTVMGAVAVAKVLGGILPIVATKLKMDPAIMASPLITTIADASTLLIYFALASSIIGF